MKVNKLILKHQLGKLIFPSDNTRVSTPKIIPEGEIIKFNHTNPETGDINPFYNRVRDEYGIVPIPEVLITAPLTEQAKRNAEARRGMRYVDEGRRNAAPYIAPIVGAAAMGAMGGAGLLKPLINPIDVGLVINDPSDVSNWIPFGMYSAPKIINRTYRIGRLLFDPTKRAAHAYVNISPIGYDNVKQRGMDWVKSILTGKDADINNPKWNINELGNKVMEYIPETVKNRELIAAYTRDDAWRIYNRLEPKYDMYIKNTDGTYSYNMDKINQLSEGTFKPILDNVNTPTDYVTSAGGGLTKYENRKLSEQFPRTYGIQTIEDVWDLHPFSRQGDLISNRFPIIEKPFKVYNKLKQSVGSKLGTLANNFKYNSKEIKNYLKTASEYENEIFDPNMFPNSKRLRSIGNTLEAFSNYIKPTKQYWEYKPLKKINDWGKNFEVGKISGGKPFKMHTEIPYTQIFNIEMSGNKNLGGFNIPHVTTQYGFIPNEGHILPFIPNPQFNLYDNNFIKGDVNSVLNNLINKKGDGK